MKIALTYSCLIIMISFTITRELIMISHNIRSRVVIVLIITTYLKKIFPTMLLPEGLPKLSGTLVAGLSITGLKMNNSLT